MTGASSGRNGTYNRPDGFAVTDTDTFEQSSGCAPEERADWGSPGTEFRQLRYFVTVAEELHFGRAASRLFISQPALSQAIAKLEAAIGVQLLVRNRQAVELTQAGTELLSRARSMLSARDEALNRIRLIDQGEAGVLRVGVAVFAEHAVMPALSALTARHPRLVIDRVVALTDRLVEQLEAGMLDAVLGHAMPTIVEMESVQSELMIKEPLAALVRHSSHLAGRSSITIAELREETLMIPPRELAPSALVGMVSMCRTFGGFEPKVYECPAMGTGPLNPTWLRNAGTEAVVFGGMSMVSSGLPTGLVAIPIAPPPLLSVALVWRRGDNSPALQRLIDLLRERRDRVDESDLAPAATGAPVGAAAHFGN
jgi:DNA-binding transcriptional LysR family regulator